MLRKRTLLWGALAVVIIIALLIYHHHNSANQKPQQPPVTISTAIAKSQTWVDQLTAVGTIKAYHGVALSPAESGVVSAIHYQSGQEVQAGQLLVELSADDLNANLANDQAALELARANYERYVKLLGDHYVSQADMDTMRAKLRQAEAAVQKSAAILAQHQVKAPFAGRLGINQIDVGQFISPGQTVVTVETLAPLYIDFRLPERYVSRVQVGQNLKLASTAFPNKTWEAKIIAISPEVDVNNRNLSLRAQTENSDRLLLPGMFVNVLLPLPQNQATVVVPQTALQYTPDGAAVYVIKKSMAHLTPVKFDAWQNNMASIHSGLKAGDEVAIAGLNKLHDGAPVISTH